MSRTVKVITGDSIYEFTADTWIIQGDQLEVSRFTPSSVVASFAKGMWIGVYKADAEAGQP